MIDDINGDGKADIFVREGNSSGEIAKSGIIFGDDSRLNTRTNAAYDIEFVQTDEMSRSLIHNPYNAKRAPDLDGDNIDDLLLLRQFRIVFISGAVMRETGRTMLNIETMTADQGFAVDANGIDVIQFNDFDGDNAPTLVFSPVISRGSTSLGLEVIDADDFLALASSNYADKFYQAARTVTPDFGAGGLNGRLKILPDTNNDGIDDIFVLADSFGNSAKVISGHVIKDTLDFTEPPNVTYRFPFGDSFQIRVLSITDGSTVIATPPVFLDDQALIVLGVTCSGPFGFQCSGIAAWDSNSIGAAIDIGEPELILRSNRAFQ